MCLKRTHVQYPDGSPVKVGDRIRLSNGDTGDVVACLDSDEFSDDYPREDWKHLRSGVLIRTDRGAVVHLEAPLPRDFLKPEVP